MVHWYIKKNAKSQRTIYHLTTSHLYNGMIVCLSLIYQRINIQSVSITFINIHMKYKFLYNWGISDYTLDRWDIGTLGWLVKNVVSTYHLNLHVMNTVGMLVCWYIIKNTRLNLFFINLKY